MMLNPVDETFSSPFHSDQEILVSFFCLHPVAVSITLAALINLAIRFCP